MEQGAPETSVSNYHYTLRHFPQERRYQIAGCCEYGNELSGVTKMWDISGLAEELSASPSWSSVS